jgi:tetratricopeptide (TPR) repeat protein
MASLIPGFEYDIFISYRQKDNKYDGWVTGFVENLKRELEATFKEDISIYFDVSPHDGLLETHDVKDSLKDKLRSLVFIPVISRTYCDPKSFAWQNEFKAFIELASSDRFGLKIKGQSGNVISRVLPVRIHDLDREDVELYESALGGYLRGVEFIYKEPGVNRPLGQDDDEKVNLNRTRYRNQINKVANAVKEIISGINAGTDISEIDNNESDMPWEEVKRGIRVPYEARPSRFKISRKLSWLVSGIMITGILLLSLYPRILRKSLFDGQMSSAEKFSVAVMPFKNMTNDSAWDNWQNGIQEIFINSFAGSDELRIRGKQSTNLLLEKEGILNYASITPSVAGKISQKLNAGIFVDGIIIKAGNRIRLNVNLINSRTEEVIKPFQVEGNAENIMQIIDSISWEVKDFLVMTMLNMEKSEMKWEEYSKEKDISYAPTKSADAYRYYLQAREAFFKNDFPAAIELCTKALKIDTNFIAAIGFIAISYYNSFRFAEAKPWVLKFYDKRERLSSMEEKINAEVVYSLLFRTHAERAKYLEQLVELDDQNPMRYFNLGDCYFEMFQYDKAVDEFEKALEIYRKWETTPGWIGFYQEVGTAYHKAKQYKKERDLYRMAKKDFPYAPDLMCSYAWLALTEGDTAKANQHIAEYTAYCKENSISEATLATNLFDVYDMAGMPDRAEAYLRRALALEPESVVRYNALGYFLIDRDRNIEEGLMLCEKGLELNPNSSGANHWKGWGLYKQGNYKEALMFLEKADSLKLIFNYNLFLHLEEARKAVASI